MAERHVTYLAAIHDFIKQPRVKFLLHNIRSAEEHGFCLTSTNSRDVILICIDPRKEFIPTLIHECLHGLYPKYKERRVGNLEKLIIRKMTPKHYINLLKCFTTYAKFYNLKGQRIKDLIN